MMSKVSFFLTTCLLALCCVTAIWMMAWMLLPDYTTPTEQPIVDLPKQTILLKNYNGKIALFSSSTDLPDTVYPIYVSMLPSLDQQRLEQGIYLDNLESAQQYLDEFDS